MFRPSVFVTNKILDQDFVTQTRTVHQHLFAEVPRSLQKDVLWKRPEKWSNGDLLLHHKNAAASCARSVREFLSRNPAAAVTNPPFFIDLFPCDIFLCPKLKLILKGKRYYGIIPTKDISQTPFPEVKRRNPHRCYGQYKNCWTRCVSLKITTFMRVGDNVDSNCVKYKEKT
jgi:hypothetical protein